MDLSMVMTIFGLVSVLLPIIIKTIKRVETGKKTYS